MVEEFLIEKVRGFDFLFNPYHKDYRDSSARQTAWEEIGKEIQMPGPAAKEMWDKLRRCFINARNRSLEARKNGSGTKKRVVWKFEEKMAFLLPFLEARKAHANYSSEAQNESHHDPPQTHEFETPQLCGWGWDDEEQKLQCSAVDDDTDSPLRKRWKDAGQNSSGQHRSVDVSREADLWRKKYEDNQGKGTRCLEGLDETDLFFLSMSRMTKKLPKIEQARIKLQLSNLVLSAEIRDQQSATGDEGNSPHQRGSAINA